MSIITEPTPLLIKKGEIFMDLIEVVNGKEKVIDHREDHNIIVSNASLLLAELCKNYNVDGITYLAIGTGDPAWTPSSPPAPTAAQTTLFVELFRKAFNSTTYVSGGAPTLTRTNVVDFYTRFEMGQATGALMEMGLFGGTGASATNGGTMVNFYTFPVINKGAANVLDITWRLTF